MLIRPAQYCLALKVRALDDYELTNAQHRLIDRIDLRDRTDP
jgi:hypothetical protein